MIKEIKLKNKLIALLVDNSNLKEDGTFPVTDSSFPLQMIMMKRANGHVFAKHTHERLERKINFLQEVIIVNKGKLLINVCSREGESIGSYEVSSGQCLFLIDGGYEIEVLEDALFYEFKNGPYIEDKILL